MNAGRDQDQAEGLLVSIPYERESTCEQDPVEIDRHACQSVSIPYERESTCEHLLSEVTGAVGDDSSFNSLRTGKYM